MSKHIGIVGCSAEGAALCYRTICADSEARMGEHLHPEVSMHTFPLGDYTPFFPADDWEGVGELMARSASKLGITGTNFLMSGPVYPDALDRQGIAYEIPDEGDRHRINGIIFGELVKGVFPDESMAYFNSVFDKLRKQGCDAVIMGCTEIPLLMDGVETPVPALDSTRILARAAIDYALE